ncbi:uncharacterized protein [Diadema setosum]|uniref:uncharacterized protein n=1 Tax=Diadema setosum TaxID=31175 RepID=UPI003B3B628F
MHGKGGGGVLTAVNATLCPRRLNMLEHPNLEMTCVEIVIGNSKWLLVSMYRPPNAAADTWEALQECIDNVQRVSSDFSGIVLVGDLNVDLLNRHSPDSSRLLSILNTLDASQLVSSITRPLRDDPMSGTLIDHLFTNRPDVFLQADVCPNPVPSDHHGVFFEIKSTKMFSTNPVIREFMLFNKGDFSHLNRQLQLVPWSLYLDPDDTNASWEGFLDIFDAAVRDAIPRTKKRSTRFRPWITREIKHMINRKRKLFRRARRTELSSDWSAFRAIRNQVKYHTRASYWHYVNNMFSLPDNRKRFFAFVRERKRHSPPPVLVVDDHVIRNPADIANGYLATFQRYFTGGQEVPAEPPKCQFPISSMESLDISVADVYRKLLTLKAKKVPGPDRLSPVLLKETAPVSAHILQRIFSISLSTGSVPTSWKRSNIIPVFKAGNKSDPSNYRTGCSYLNS